MTKTAPAYIGCDYYAGHFDHLEIAHANNVTADAYGETYLDGNNVIVLAKNGSDVYGFAAVATGDVKGMAIEFWPNFHKETSPANGLKVLSEIKQIPSELLGRLGQRGIATLLRSDVWDYLTR